MADKIVPIGPADTAPSPQLSLVDNIDLICKLDRITSMVDLAHGVLHSACSGGHVGFDGDALEDAWLTLEVAQEKLSDFRDELEQADAAASVAHG